MNGPWSDSPRAWVGDDSAWVSGDATVLVGVATAGVACCAATAAPSAVAAVNAAMATSSAPGCVATPFAIASIPATQAAVAAQPATGVMGTTVPATPAGMSFCLQAGEVFPAASVQTVRSELALAVAQAGIVASAVSATPSVAITSFVGPAASAGFGLAELGFVGVAVVPQPATVTTESVVSVQVGTAVGVWSALPTTTSVAGLANASVAECHLEEPAAAGTPCAVALSEVCELRIDALSVSVDVATTPHLNAALLAISVQSLITDTGIREVWRCRTPFTSQLLRVTPFASQTIMQSAVPGPVVIRSSLPSNILLCTPLSRSVCCSTPCEVEEV